MGGFLKRYYRRKQLELHCEIVTPIFLGNANQEAEWRAAPFKSLLRYWWRVTQHNRLDFRDLLQAESVIFGSAGDRNGEAGGKSTFKVFVGSTVKPANAAFPKVEDIIHPETKSERNKEGKVNPLLYLAGMGIIPGGKVLHSYFPEKSPFKITLEFPENLLDQIKPVLALLQAFGAVGARCRNGWGSFQVLDPKILPTDEAIAALNAHTKPWEEGFSRDYPNCLGKDAQQCPLLWKLREPQDYWHGAMRKLAEAYVGVRAKSIKVDNEEIGALDPGGKDAPSERHLLGFPLTNHPARKALNWGDSARHASPLRFVVRRRGDTFLGFVLHLPYSLSNRMRFMQVEDEIAVWKEKVHPKLNSLMEHAKYEECL